MRELMNLVEAFTIRVLWVIHATRMKRTPGLCPPQCSEDHTYKWPCRARIRRPKKSNVGAYHDDPIAKVTKITEDESGVKVEARFIDRTTCGAKRAGGWGSVAKTCTFPKDHEKFGMPHSWVVQ